MSSDRTAADIYGRDFPAGSVLFEEGDPGSRMYVIQAGEVRIEKQAGAGRVTLAVLGPGEAFGEMALLEGQPRSASAVVEKDARILEIDQAAFADLVKGNGEVALRLLRRLSARLREANRQIRNFLSADAMGRAVEALKALCGPPGDDGFRPIPEDVGPARVATTPAMDSSEVWRRLRAARLVREVGDRAELAPPEVVEAYLRYTELRARFEALSAGALDEVAALGEEGAPFSPELLGVRLAAEGSERGFDAPEWDEYQALRRRFGADEGGRKTS
ncbi:MAG: cyclic nucleotide-binding domain-containing protein [Anaeromyxobacter sp.]